MASKYHWCVCCRDRRFWLWRVLLWIGLHNGLLSYRRYFPTNRGTFGRVRLVAFADHLVNGRKRVNEKGVTKLSCLPCTLECCGSISVSSSICLSLESVFWTCMLSSRLGCRALSLSIRLGFVCRCKIRLSSASFLTNEAQYPSIH